MQYQLNFYIFILCNIILLRPAIQCLAVHPGAQILDCNTLEKDSASRLHDNYNSSSNWFKDALNSSTTIKESDIIFPDLRLERSIVDESIGFPSGDCPPNVKDPSKNNDSTASVGFSSLKLQDYQKLIEITIDNVRDASLQSTDHPESNVNKVSVGSTFRSKCRFRVLTSDQDLRFNLRWLRSIRNEPQGKFTNQSITTRHEDDRLAGAVEDRKSSGDNRLTTVQQDGGLDLIISNFQIADSGDYFCQAILSQNDQNYGPPKEQVILDEKRVRIEAEAEVSSSSTDAAKDRDDLNPSGYSQKNLLKFMPSLVVLPEYVETSLGNSVQLACVTNDLDPDPEQDAIEWSFQRLSYANDSSDEYANDSADNSLPPNTTAIGNILIIWSVSKQHPGIYLCTVQMDEYNLTAQASSELALRPNADSAPLVFVSPDLIRLSANGSARIQCEATGYPAPKIDWYRVDSIIPPGRFDASIANASNSSDYDDIKNVQILSADQTNSISPNTDGSLEIEYLNRQDALAYCKQVNCVTTNRSRSSRPEAITALSMIHLKHARADHQGQYVCKATNKHGTNQASCLIDVEFKELPLVSIDREQQTITLPLEEATHSSSGNAPPTSAGVNNAKFKCSIVAGRPRPKLIWLRITGNLQQQQQQHSRLLGKISANFSQPTSSSDLDIYDLSKVSSATSYVSTRSEDDGKSLILQLNTVSIYDEGEYVCLAENALGRHSAVAHLIVRRPANVRIVQSSPKLARPNESFHLDCRIYGHPKPQDIEWSRSDRGAFFALISNQPEPQKRAVLKFDRVTEDDAGEYTCAARDPFNSSVIVRDTIMVLVQKEPSPDKLDIDGLHKHQVQFNKQLPKLMVRPTKVVVVEGSNISIDCLAMSGLQPTIVEWLAPHSSIEHSQAGHSSASVVSIRPYYRSPVIDLDQHSSASFDHTNPVLQFGSKLRIFNASKAHEGVYQCKGRNRVGTENAPALIEIIEPASASSNDKTINSGAGPTSGLASDNNHSTTKTKIAQAGTNIELRCQVNGLEQQPATSWSREGKELPKSSVQIEHNLWIQHLTQADEGLYLCSARSNEPNQIIQAKINLLVREFASNGLLSQPNSKYDQAMLQAKIVVSKSLLNVGDSVTLECMISQNLEQTTNGSSTATKLSTEELDELERQVYWTNLHSGQSLFQDNVYIQNNLLIIYDLKAENAATYRCNYNDLSQHVDYEMQVIDSEGRPIASNIDYGSKRLTSSTATTIDQNLSQKSNSSSDRISLRQASPNSRLVLNCLPDNHGDHANAITQYHWTRANNRQPILANKPLVFESIQTHQADLYQCHYALSSQANNSSSLLVANHIVQVHTSAAKFYQRTVSFLTLPAASISTTDRQVTEIDVKFMPERDHGLILFSGGNSRWLRSLDQTSDDGLKLNDTDSSQAHPVTRPLSNADFISLGINKGHIELRFELGDGVTLMRSSQKLALNQWHRIVIERNLRNSTLWLDGHQPQTRLSAGKFFDLNLDDSVLFVGGHQVFLSLQKSSTTDSPSVSTSNRQQRFYGYTSGFQGCISYLRINGRDLDLMNRNRAVSVGVFECDKQECQDYSSPNDKPKCLPQPDAFCQVDRSADGYYYKQRTDIINTKRALSLASSDLRCICGPSRSGPACNETLSQTIEIDLTTTNRQPAIDEAPNTNKPRPSLLQQYNRASSSTLQSSIINGPCEQSQESGCNSSGTLECQSLTSTSYKCHCRLGFMGQQCEREANFINETAVCFRQAAYLQFQFRDLDSNTTLQEDQANYDVNGKSISASDFVQLTSFTEQINISFVLQTRSSYGLIFYIGSQMSQVDLYPRRKVPAAAASSSTRSHHNSSSSNPATFLQTSKSVVANLLARLTQRSNAHNNNNNNNNKAVADFLAIALIDGHVELSFELGSGPAIIRSSRRVNDGAEHKIVAWRQAKQGQLMIDDSFKYEGQSPGRLSMLNTGPDIYLGGLPRLQSASHSSSALLMSTFSGCISQLRLNPLATALNLIRSNQLTQIKLARNLVPFELSAGNNNISQEELLASLDAEMSQHQLATTDNQNEMHTISTAGSSSNSKPSRSTTIRPSDSDPDDPDELRSSSR